MPNTTLNPILEVLSKDHVFLSVESTDLDGRIIKIQIADHQGNFLLDTLLHPRWKIKKGKPQSKHHITDAMAFNAPRWKDLLPTIEKLTQGKKVIVYNFGFINAVFYTTSLKYHTPHLSLDLFCLMEVAAQSVGDWSEFHESYTYVSLENLCSILSISLDKEKKVQALHQVANSLKNRACY